MKNLNFFSVVKLWHASISRDRDCSWCQCRGQGVGCGGEMISASIAAGFFIALVAGEDERVSSWPPSLSVNPNPAERLAEGDALLVPWLFSWVPSQPLLILILSVFLGLQDSQLQLVYFLSLQTLLMMVDGFFRSYLHPSLYYLPYLFWGFSFLKACNWKNKTKPCNWNAKNCYFN